MALGPTPEWVERYQTNTHPLPGWFSDVDLHLFALINEIQLASRVAGDLLEVGAYLGKSAVPLGFMCRENESLTIIDLWDQAAYLEALEHQDRYRGRVSRQEAEARRIAPHNRAEFTANYRRFHDRLPDIRQGLSSEHLTQLPAERFRFIHIDGAHDWGAVSGDLNQALRILLPGGVVVFDDVFHPDWPGIGAAVWPACAKGDLVPIATTSNKLYATRAPSSVSAASIARVVEEDPELLILALEPMFEWDVLVVTGSPPPPPPPPLLGRLLS